MAMNLNYLTAQEQGDDLVRERRRHRRRVEVRRVAVIRSADSHFKVLPTRATLEAMAG